MISVIIPTCNRETSLLLTVQALVGTSCSESFEVIVVNDGEPFEAATVKTLNSLERVHVIRSGAHNVSIARNIGVNASSGRLLAFIDDDVIPGPEWLETISKVLHHRSDIAGITGRVNGPPCEHRILDRLRTDAYNMREERIRQAENIAMTRVGVEAYAINYFSGGNCAMPCQVFRDLGGFDPSFTKSQDRELALRILSKGGLIYYLPSLEVQHDNRHVGWSNLLRGRYLSGYFAAQLEDRHPQKFSARVERLHSNERLRSPLDRLAHFVWVSSFNLGLRIGRLIHARSDGKTIAAESV